MELPLRIKYFDKNIEKLKKTEKGDWIDLRSAIDISLKKKKEISRLSLLESGWSFLTDMKHTLCQGQAHSRTGKSSRRTA